MQKSNNTVRDIIVVGFALFSMFFGAGNVVFPPYLSPARSGCWASPPISSRTSVWRCWACSPCCGWAAAKR